MKTSELSGPQLDYWVAKAENYECQYDHLGQCTVRGQKAWIAFAPSKVWAHAGPLILSRRISVSWCYQSKTWCGQCWKYVDGQVAGQVLQWSNNDDPLEAAMRCLVACVFGEEVSDGTEPEGI